MMTSEGRLRMDALDALAMQDATYQDLLRQMCQVEKKYNAVLQNLRHDDRVAVDDYVSLREEINWYMLELACKYMRFP